MLTKAALIGTVKYDIKLLEQQLEKMKTAFKEEQYLAACNLSDSMKSTCARLFNYTYKIHYGEK